MASKEVEQLARAYFEDIKEGKKPNPIAVDLASNVLFEKVAGVISQDRDLAPEAIKTLLRSDGKLEANARGEFKVEVARGKWKKYFSWIPSDSTITLKLGYEDEKLTEKLTITAHRRDAKTKNDALPGFLYFKSLSNEESGQIELERYETDARAFASIQRFLEVYEQTYF